jgi:hypothetical protein
MSGERPIQPSQQLVDDLDSAMREGGGIQLERPSAFDNAGADPRDIPTSAAPDASLPPEYETTTPPEATPAPVAAPGARAPVVQLAPPPDPNIARDSKAGQDKAKQELQDTLELRPLLENVKKKFDATQDEDYGMLQGGSIPWLSDKLRGVGLPGNRNELEELEVDAGKGNAEMQQRVARRREFTATRQDLASVIQRLRTGLAANKQEMDRIDTIQGVIDSKEFASNKNTRAQVMQQIFDMYNRNAAILEQRVKDRGVRLNQGPVAGPLETRPRDSGPPGGRPRRTHPQTGEVREWDETTKQWVPVQ